MLIVLSIATAWAYSTSFRGAFVFDDISSIAENPSIRSLWPPGRALWAPGEVTTSGRPVANLSFAMNYALAPGDVRDVMAPSGVAARPGDAEKFRRNVWGYHFANIAIHILAALALFGVVRRTLIADRLRGIFGDSAAPVAFAAALLWAVHPLNTEAVTYIVQRVESLMGLFYLTTLYCAIRAWPTDPTDRPTDRLSRYWVAAAIAACALGMGTKENMVGAPIAVALWDLIFKGPQRMKDRRGLYAGLALTWAVLALLVMLEPRERSVGLDLGWTWHSYLLTQSEIIVHYLRLAIWPSPLVFDYGWPGAESFADVGIQFFALTGLVALTVGLAIRQHAAAFPLTCFFLILAPTSSVLPITTEVAAEHRMFLPLAAVVSLGVAFGTLAGREFARWAGISAAVAKTGGLILLLILALPLAIATRERNLDYRSEETLYVDTIEKRPGNARAFVGYGAVMLGQGRFAEAETHLRRGVALDPLNALAHMNLGGSLCALNRCDEGLPHLEEAVRLKPNLPQVHGMLGEAYAGRGDERRALGSLERAAELMPTNPFVLHRLATQLTFSSSELRDPVRAVALAREAIRLDSEQAFFYHTLAMAYAEAGNVRDALGAAEAGIAAAEATGESALAAEMRDLRRRLQQPR